jgi:arylsulfatase A-like enzyme
MTGHGGKIGKTVPPNILVVLFDDVGFADLGCYGSAIATPTIDALAARGVRLTGFHTTAMCSTTRAALLTGCNHHRVGMGCLANFDSGYPGYRGKIAPEAGPRCPRCCARTAMRTTWSASGMSRR